MTNQRHTFLKTEDLDLVLLTKEDAPVLIGWFNNYDVAKFLARGDYPMTQSFEEEYLEKLYKDKAHLQLGLWHRKDRKLVGTVGVHKIDPTHLQAEFGITIGDPDYWSGGLGTQALEAIQDWAFNRRGLRLLTLRVLGNNPRGKKCYEKCGFKFAGTFPEAVFKDGKWVDEHFMFCQNPNLEQ